MLGLRLICVGKMKESFYIAAFEEYVRRLTAFCRLDTVVLPESKLPAEPSDREISAALEKESSEVLAAIPGGAYVIAMCVEGRQMSSARLAELFDRCAVEGRSRICFVIGGSFGLHDSVKVRADLKLSMSEMTFPHHLARVMLAEQIYRAFSINAGSKYHK